MVGRKVYPAGEEWEEFPIPGSTTRTMKLDREFVRMRDTCEDHLDLADGRRLSYFRLGCETNIDPTNDPVLVIAFHGGCEGKWRFMQRKPVEGILLVSVDRPGYGKSSTPHVGYTWKDAAADVLALARSLGYEQFVLTGHSVGGMWCQQLAVCLRAHVRGIILWASVSDFGSIKSEEHFIKKAGRPPGPLHPTKGCCGCILRSSFTQYSRCASSYDFVQNVKNEQKHAPQGWKRVQDDPFFLSVLVSAWRAFDRPDGILVDADMCLFAGTHGLTAGQRGHQEVSSLECPIHSYHGDRDVDLGTTYPGAVEYQKHLWAHVVHEVCEGDGHISVLGPNDASQERLRRAVANMPPLSN